MRRLFLFAGITACALSHALVLDGFTDGFASNSTKVDFNYDVSASVPGGIRSIDHAFTANPNNRNILTELLANDPGRFYIESGSNVNGAVNLYYGGGALPGTPNSRPLDFPDFNGLGGVDLSSFSAFKASYLGNDQNSTTFAMRVFDGTNTGVFTGTPVAQGSGMVLIPFAAFVGGVNFANVDKIHLQVGLPDGNDITLTNFEAVPEPATMTLLGLGAVAMLRRRKKA